MRRTYGSQSMIAPLKRAVVRRPDASFAVDDPARWHYAARPDLPAAQGEHDHLTGLLSEAGVEVIRHTAPLPDHADAIFVFDPVLVTDEGAVILRMGKPQRRGEEEALGRCLETHGVPILDALEADALAEGGDLLWLDHQTLVAGLGFRTNAAGVAQLEAILAPLGVDILPVQLPYFTGPAACLHLLSLVSIVNHRLAVVFPPLLPVPFWEHLRERGYQLIEVPETEFASMGTNILALRPGRCLMLEGNPVTERRLEEAGCSVVTYRGKEISLKAEGGPTCLTRPILRGD